MPVEDLNECKNAVKWIQTQYVGIPSDVSELDSASDPRGCSVYVQEDYEEISFNTHSSGSAESDFRQVCKEEVKGTLSNALDTKLISR